VKLVTRGGALDVPEDRVAIACAAIAEARKTAAGVMGDRSFPSPPAHREG
jgi:hypothetical protein